MKDWMEGLPEDMHGNELLNRYDTLEDVGKALIEQRATLSNSMRLPSEEASPEDRNQFINDLMTKLPEVMIKPDFEQDEQSKEFYKTLGVPETADAYQNPEEVELTPELEADLRETALALNMTPVQYKQFAEKVGTQVSTQSTQMAEAHKAGMEALKGKWGAAYEVNMELAKKAYSENTADPERKFENMDAAGVETFYNIAKQMTGDGPQVGDQPLTVPQAAMTPDEAQNRINEIFANKEHPYLNPGHPDHARAVARMLDLQDYAHGRTPPEGSRPGLPQMFGR